MSTSDLNPANGQNGSDAIPSTDPVSVSMREVMTRFLFQASPESILTHDRLIITPEHVVHCSPTYGLALYELVINRGIQIHLQVP